MMKTLSILIALFSLTAFNHPENTKDLAVDNVQQKFTSKGGVYFIYSIKNEGHQAVEGIEYKVKFKLNGKIISFDKSPRTLEPGEKLEFQTSYVEYENTDGLNYALEIKVKDENQDNNTLKGSF